MGQALPRVARTWALKNLVSLPVNRPEQGSKPSTIPGLFIESGHLETLTLIKSKGSFFIYEQRNLSKYATKEIYSR